MKGGEGMTTDREPLDEQHSLWETVYSRKADLFGEKPSQSAIKAIELFGEEGIGEILELGVGQGRDALFFADHGLHVHVMDYSSTGLRALSARASHMGLSDRLKVSLCDIREGLRLDDESIPCCYSHMFFCMAFSASEIRSMTREVWRVLKAGGLHVYTARTMEDPHYGRGTHRGEDLYQFNRYIVHFFSRSMVEELAGGFEMMELSSFEEGDLPRKLFMVVLRKPLKSRG
jgi:ubiquinone/menaquinone biosynthesis C-methylase UbiE